MERNDGRKESRMQEIKRTAQIIDRLVVSELTTLALSGAGLGAGTVQLSEGNLIAATSGGTAFVTALAASTLIRRRNRERNI